MKFTIMDRIVIGSLYPEKGNFIQMTLVEDITKKIKIGQKEITEIELKQVSVDNGISYQWKKDKANDLDVKFTNAEIDLLKTQIKELDKKGEITISLLSICKKIREA